MKFNYLILFLLFQLEYIRPLYKSEGKSLGNIDFKINFDKMVQVSLTKNKQNSNDNFFLQLRENTNQTNTENLSKDLTDSSAGNSVKSNIQNKIRTESILDEIKNSNQVASSEDKKIEIPKDIENYNLKANSINENEKRTIEKKLSNKNLSNLNKIFAKRISEQSISKIKSIKTEVTIHSDSPDGYVNEKVNFKLEKGKFNKIVKKFSLGGTSDKLHSFRISTSDVKLTSAKIFDNCLDKNISQEPAYICVIAYMDEIEHTDESKTIEIIYDYVSEDIVRKRDRPFSNNQQENNLLFIYDNFNSKNTIENLSLTMNFQHKLDLDNLTGYPEKYTVKTQDHSLYTIIKWENQSINSNEFKNFALTMPVFTHDCLGINEFHLEISTLTIIKIFLGILLLLILSITCIPYLLFKCNKKSEEKLFDV